MRKTLNTRDLVKVAGDVDMVGVGTSEVVERRLSSRRRRARVVLLVQELQLGGRRMLQRACLQVVQQLDVVGVFKHLLEVRLRQELALATEQNHDLCAQPIVVVGRTSQPEEVFVEIAASLHCRQDRRAEGWKKT
jgi:hypothetical protein